MEIESNIPQATVDTILPLGGITIQEDESEREEPLSKLEVLSTSTVKRRSSGEKSLNMAKAFMALRSVPPNSVPL